MNRLTCLELDRATGLSRRWPSTLFSACLGLALSTTLTPLFAQELNTSALSQNGWYSDDTRADGTGTQIAGTNLISPTLTAAPEGASMSANPAHDADIQGQIEFLPAPGTVPFGTHQGALHLNIGPSGSGKSTASHRKDDLTGHAPGSAIGPALSVAYSWMADGTISVTPAFKLGFKTAEFGMAPVSTRTGENSWDKLLIYEPNNLNGGTADGLWHTETISFTSGKWWIVDRVANGNTIGTPLELNLMSGSGIVFGSNPRTIATSFAAVVAPGSILTCVQFGIGSGNALGNVYVNQLATNFYRAGQLTTFGQQNPFDQNVTPEVLFGAGNTNGAFTLSTAGGLELGLRSKLRNPSALNIYNSNGDGTYTWPAGAFGAPDNARWNFEWAVNTDPKGLSGDKVDDRTYELGIDYDPSQATDFLTFDPITQPYGDHSFGDNSFGNGAGIEAPSNDTVAYANLLSTYNVAQNSWQMKFFDAPFSSFTFDPTVPGRYDFYLAAFANGVEVARTEMAVIAVNGNTLSLEGSTCQQDAFPGTPGVQIEAELWLRNPNDVSVTGFQSFLDFNAGAMTYEGGLSSYESSVFLGHIQSIATAQVAAGKLRLDGNTFPSLTGTSGDEKLATLVFTVNECSTNAVAFDLTQAFSSELSFQGTPLPTSLLNGTPILADDTAPVIAPLANQVRPADAGSCTQAVVTYPAPMVTDNCDPMPSVVCSPASGSVFPVGMTTVTCTATDACGNVAVGSFTVTVNATNAVDVVVELPGSVAATRCIRFVPDSCSSVVDIPLNFTGSNPAVAMVTIEIPCGNWTTLCAKDRQHTQWANGTLSLVGQKYVLTLPLELAGGDTDDDGDIDINDVTLLLAQFGTSPATGGCPWDGVTRSADFSNNGPVAAEDYAFLVSGWLTTSACACTLPLTGGGQGLDRRRSVPARGANARADLDGNGVIDFRDVEVLEARYGLSGELSRLLRD